MRNIWTDMDTVMESVIELSKLVHLMIERIEALEEKVNKFHADEYLTEEDNNDYVAITG